MNADQWVGCFKSAPLHAHPQQEVSGKEWITVLKRIVELTAETRERLDAEKSDLENFLLQLTDRLKELDQHLEVAELPRRTSCDDGERFDRTVTAEMSQFDSSVHQASNLDQIKVAIQQRVEVICKHMHDYRRAEA